MFDDLVHDLRYGVRTLRGSPGFATIAVLSLALGIGANTAIFSFMDAILVRSLPVPNPASLASINWHAKSQPPVIHMFMMTSGGQDPKLGYTSGNFPYAAFELFAKDNPVCSSIFAFGTAGRPTLLARGQAELSEAEYVSGAYFSGLSVPPAAGRLIDFSDDAPGAPAVAVISFRYWQRRFGLDVKALGESVLINNSPFTIVGVTAPEFYGVDPAAAPDVFIPVHTSPMVDSGTGPFGNPNAKYAERNFYWVQMMGRLRSGVGIAQAQSALAGMFQNFVRSTASNDRERADLPVLFLTEGAAGLDSLRRQYSRPLYVLMAMVVLILAIACANTANLLLARAAARQREMAVRLSMGASRLRVVGQLLTESVLLAGLGGALGVLFAKWGIRSLTLLLDSGRDRFNLRADLNWHVLGVTLAVSVLTGVLFGLAPALQATKVDLVPALKEVRSASVPSHLGRFLRFNLSHALVVTQISLSVLLLVAAGLFVRTLSNLESVQLGFNQGNVLLFTVNARQAGLKDRALAQFYSDLQTRLSRLPGVRSASQSNIPLLAGGRMMMLVTLPGGPPPPTPGSPVPINPGNIASVLAVGPSFLSTMQIPLLVGREVEDGDISSGRGVAVVNQEFVKHFLSGVNPLGTHFRMGQGDFEIIGIAKNARYFTLKEDPPTTAYIGYGSGFPPLNQMTFEVRTAGDPLALATTVRQIVHDLDARTPVSEVKTEVRQIDQTISQERTFAMLCACFAVLALVIASVGLYGTMSYSVVRRTSEIGIRMALGAERARVVRMVLREVFAMTLVGLAIGLPVAYATAHFIESFLFGLKGNDPVTMSLAAVFLLVAAIIAGYVPAHRASRIDPAVALRNE